MSKAQAVFWAKGYEAASVTDLCAATGLKPGSLYAAFESKAGLFDQVVELYQKAAARAYIDDAMGASTVDELVHRWLTGVVYFVTGTTTPHGCLLVRSSHLCEEPVASALRARYRIGEAALIERIDRAVADGDLSGHVRPQMVVRFIMTLAQGIAVEAAMGVERGELLEMVETLTARLPWESRNLAGQGKSTSPNT
ncbi:TetR/AcrR family transcriptional regulator [Nocardia thailandica]